MSYHAQNPKAICREYTLPDKGKKLTRKTTFFFSVNASTTLIAINKILESVNRSAISSIESIELVRFIFYFLELFSNIIWYKTSN